MKNIIKIEEAYVEASQISSIEWNAIERVTMVTLTNGQRFETDERPKKFKKRWQVALYEAYLLQNGVIITEPIEVVIKQQLDVMVNKQKAKPKEKANQGLANLDLGAIFNG